MIYLEFNELVKVASAKMQLTIRDLYLTVADMLHKKCPELIVDRKLMAELDREGWPASIEQLSSYKNAVILHNCLLYKGTVVGLLVSRYNVSLKFPNVNIHRVAIPPWRLTEWKKGHNWCVTWANELIAFRQGRLITRQEFEDKQQTYDTDIDDSKVFTLELNNSTVSVATQIENRYLAYQKAINAMPAALTKSMEKAYQQYLKYRGEPELKFYQEQHPATTSSK